MGLKKQYRLSTNRLISKVPIPNYSVAHLILKNQQNEQKSPYFRAFSIITGDIITYFVFSTFFPQAHITLLFLRVI